MMKKTLACITLIVMLLITINKPVQAVELGVDVGAMYYTWEEDISPGTVKETGFLPTVGVSIEGAPFMEIPALRLRSDMMVFVGNVNYDTLPADTETKYLSFKVEGNTGWRIASEQAYLEPFLGLAYRIWERDIKSTSAAQGYPELYRALYGKVGIRGGHKLPRGITFVSTISFDPMIWVRERINWTSISGEILRVKNGRRVGWTIEGGVQRKALKATAYWQATRLGKSTEVSCMGGTSICWQPKSLQDVIGIKFGYVF